MIAQVPHEKLTNLTEAFKWDFHSASSAFLCLPLKIWVAGFWICLFDLPLPWPVGKKTPGRLGQGSWPFKEAKSCAVWLPRPASPEVLRGEARSLPFRGASGLEAFAVISVSRISTVQWVSAGWAGQAGRRLLGVGRVLAAASAGAELRVSGLAGPLWAPFPCERPWLSRF